MQSKRWLPLSLALVALGLPACDAAEPSSPQPLALSVQGLSGGACGDAESPDAGVDPFADIEDLTVFIKGTSLDGDAVDLCERHPIAGSSITIASVPEGKGHDFEMFGTGGQLTWYAREPDLDVERNTQTPLDLLLVPWGGFACVPTQTTYNNVVFPASVELPDGRILITGGFSAVQTDGGKTFLTQPTNQAALFEPRTGQLEHLGPMGSGTDLARAGHAMAYVPSGAGEHSGKVLIVGGLTRLELDLDEDFAFLADDNKTYVLNDYVLFDVASKTFSAGGTTMAQKRAFPRVHTMPDESVIITGGGSWPDEPSSSYLDVELWLYDAEVNDGTGRFLPTKSFTSFYPRNGHSLTFLEESDGLARLLVWGGTSSEDEDPTNEDDGADLAVAEIIKQSAQQTDPTSPSDGSFQRVAVRAASGSSIPRTWFHEMTRLTTLQDGDQVKRAFLLTGGAPAASERLGTPPDDAAWVIVYGDEDGPAATVTEIPGLGSGRVFHTASTSDLSRVTVLGGFLGGEAVTDGAIRFFDLFGASPWGGAPEAATGFAPRGGHAGVAMRTGSLLLLGGESDLDGFGQSPHRAFVEVYTPSNIPGIQKDDPCSDRVE